MKEQLKAEITKLEKMLIRFNDLHRKAKYLKKDMVKQRELIEDLERKLNAD